MNASYEDEDTHIDELRQTLTARMFAVTMAKEESEAQAMLTAAVRDALHRVPRFPGNDDSLAAAAVGVFIEFLTNPPVREINTDGSSTIRWDR